MTTVLDQKQISLEHTDIHRALDIPPVQPVTKVPARRPWARAVAIGASAGVLGLALGYGIAAWQYTDEIDQLQNASGLITQVPFGGFASEYGAPREHLAQAQVVADNVPVAPPWVTG